MYWSQQFYTSQKNNFLKIQVMKAKWNYNITQYENIQSSYILNTFFKFTTSQSNKTKKHTTKEIYKGKGKKY